MGVACSSFTVIQKVTDLKMADVSKQKSSSFWRFCPNILCNCTEDFRGDRKLLLHFSKILGKWGDKGRERERGKKKAACSSTQNQQNPKK